MQSYYIRQKIIGQQPSKNLDYRYQSSYSRNAMNATSPENLGANWLGVLDKRVKQRQMLAPQPSHHPDSETPNNLAVPKPPLQPLPPNRV